MRRKLLIVCICVYAELLEKEKKECKKAPSACMGVRENLPGQRLYRPTSPKIRSHRSHDHEQSSLNIGRAKHKEFPHLYRRPGFGQIHHDYPRSVDRLIGHIHDGSVDEQRLVTSLNRPPRILRQVDLNTTLLRSSRRLRPYPRNAVLRNLVAPGLLELLDRRRFGADLVDGGAPGDALGAPVFVDVAEAVDQRAAPHECAQQMGTADQVAVHDSIQVRIWRAVGHHDIDWQLCESWDRLLCDGFGPDQTAHARVEAIFVVLVRERPLAEVGLVRRCIHLLGFVSLSPPA